MDSKQATTQLQPVLGKRLGLKDKEAGQLASAYVSAVLSQAVDDATSLGLAPTSLASARTELVLRLIDELQRTPSIAEVAALLRVTESTARSALNQALAASDDARGLALRSVFARAKNTGSVGNSSPIPQGKIWRFLSYNDLALAKRELERAAVRFLTQSSKDGSYVLVVDKSFTP